MQSKSTRIISPFPPDIDRDAFGHWLSGFVDGEGCFYLSYCRKMPEARFMLNLRIDDRPILELIRSYWGCGSLTVNRCRKYSNPQICYRVPRVADMWKVVVSHFDRYPLRAKKARDFVIWREAALLAFEAYSRRTVSIRAAGGRIKGTLRTWTKAERERFVELRSLLMQQRKCETGGLPLPIRPVVFASPPTLFD